MDTVLNAKHQCISEILVQAKEVYEVSWEDCGKRAEKAGLGGDGGVIVDQEGISDTFNNLELMMISCGGYAEPLFVAETIGVEIA